MMKVLSFFCCDSHESFYPLPESKLILSYYFSAPTCTQFTVMCLIIVNKGNVLQLVCSWLSLSQTGWKKKNVCRVKNTISLLLTTTTFYSCLGVSLGFCLGVFFVTETKRFIYLVKLLCSGASCCFSQQVKSYLEFAKRLTISSKI